MQRDWNFSTERIGERGNRCNSCDEEHHGQPERNDDLGPGSTLIHNGGNIGG